MPTYNELCTTAFRLIPNGIQAAAEPLSVLRFPRAWLNPILELQRRVRPNQWNVSINNLNRAVLALVPDVAAVTRGVGSSSHPGQWLYSAGRPEIEGLQPILHAWLRSSVDQGHADEASQLWERLAATPLSWEQVDASDLAWGNHDRVAPDTPEATGALEALPNALFQLLPEILAAELLRRGDRPEGFPRGFRRCATSNGGKVELVSWPPLEYETRGGQRWPFSYLICVSVQTVPFQPDPFVHVRTGIRRWCRTAPRTGRGRGVNAYLLTDVPWIGGLARSRSFRMAPMRWARADEGWRLCWRNELRDLFDQIAFDRELPDLAELTNDPLKYLTGLGEDRALAVVFGTSSGNRHPVGAGVSARDRDRLTRWIGDALEDLLRPTQPLPRVPMTLRARSSPEAHTVRGRLAEATRDGQLVVEVHWDTERARDAVRQALVSDLGLETTPPVVRDGALSAWRTPELALTLTGRPIGALGAALEPNQTIRDRRSRARRAAQPRIEAVGQTLGMTRSTTLAIVELRGPEAFPEPGTDPKAALRVGFAASGRLTQFLTPEPAPDRPNDLSHRAAEAWLDLRRQLIGLVQTSPPPVNGVELPDPADTVAVYMLRRNATSRHWADRHQLPIAVWTSPDSSVVWARTFGMNDWRPYAEVLRHLASGVAFKLPDHSRRATESFIWEVVRSARQDRPVLLLTWTQNLRLDWSDLQNKKVVIDHPMLNGQPLRDVAPTLRHVMVRTRDFDETPQCYGVTADGDRVGLPSGLFRLPGSSRVFASVAPKPASAQSHGSPMGSRTEVRLNRNGRPVVETTKNVFNPQYVELTVAACREGDDAVAWAALAHAQRNMSDAYQDTLMLPGQLHLARKATEYAIPDASMDDDTFDVSDDPSAVADNGG